MWFLQKEPIPIYDYHGVEFDLSTATNGWTIREDTVYDTDGVTVTERYEYDSSGRLI